jgi:AAA family ATP:ADP antiporter
MADVPEQPTSSKNFLDRLLNLFAETRSGEGVTAVLLFLNVFLILAAYYVLKSVREGLIIGGGGMLGLDGDELKIYASAAMAVMLLGIVPAYGALASKVNRIKLLNYSVGSVVVSLGIFFVLANARVPLGLAFYLWLGIVNVFLIAQFWSYANDIYTEEQGKRLFAIIAVGGSLGAILGPRLAKLEDNINLLMPMAAGVLVVSIVLYNIVNRREARRVGLAADDIEVEGAKLPEEPLSKEGGFHLVFGQRYLLLIAVMLLLANLVNTTGEFILANAAKKYSAAQVQEPNYDEFRAAKRAELSKAGTEAPATSADQPALPLEQRVDRAVAAEKQRVKDARKSAAKNFFAEFFFWVNLVGFLIQAFLVSRIFKYLGVRTALFFLPFIALGAYGAIALIGGLTLLRVAKTAENSTDYSLQNTVRQALFLPTSREVKYKAKAAIDTFFVRFGDAAAAGVVAIGLNVLDFKAIHFAAVNCVLILAWIAVSVGIAREHKKMVPDDKTTDL